VEEIFTSNRQITNILFVCIGNICRSPFAQGLFTKTAADKGCNALTAESAGLLALPGNPATTLAQRVAAEHGVDLSAHTAKPLSKTLVMWSHLILVMENAHKDTLVADFPEATDKTMLIRNFARFGSKTRGIADPYGLEYDAYRFCYLDIEDAISGLITYLSDRFSGGPD
jgi:protein-tyrosine phosphatase